MAVYDRWHTRRPRTDPKTGKPVRACRRCGTTAEPYPTAEHGKGNRWQVRWRDESKKQCKVNRPRKGGKRDESDPEIYAEALAAKIESELNAGTYVAPKAGKIILEEWVAQWRATLTGDPVTLRNLDDRLAHICDAEPREGQRKSRRAPPGPR